MRLVLVDAHSGTLRVLECSGRKYSDVATYVVAGSHAAWSPAMVEAARVGDVPPVDGQEE
jgi:hypothetical protein